MKNRVFKQMAAGAAALILALGGTGAFSLNAGAIALDIPAPVVTDAETFTDGDYEYVLLKNGTAKITKYNGTEHKVKIPGTLGEDEVKVTEIGRRAFYESDVTGVTVPDSVSRICELAFYRCMQLAEVRLSSRVEYIENEAFSMCLSLSDITLPKKLISIGNNAFYRCEELKEINIPANVYQLSVSAFQGCTGLKAINVDSSNRYFTSYDGAVYDRKKTVLTMCPQGKDSIDIPSTVTRIGECAFAGCTKFTEFTIPESVLRIGEYAFGGCTGLTGVSIHDKVVSLGSSAFGGCTGLTEITLPESVTSLGEYAFNNCTGLKTVTIKGALADIKEDTFINCDSLETVVLPDSVAAIREAAFCHCDKLKNINFPSGLKTIDYRAFDCCFSLENVVIPEGASVIRWAAFRSCRNLKTVTLPESLEVIEDAAFGYYFGDNGTGDLTRIKDFTIICPKDSVAEQYAKDNGFRYATADSDINPAFSWSVSKTAIELRWEPVQSAEKYGVACCIDGKWQLAAQGNKTSYVIKDLKPGRYYDVAVVAKFNGKWNMDFSTAATIRTESIYPVVSCQIKDKHFRLKWTPVPDAEKYCIADNKYSEKTGQNEWFIKAQLNSDITTYTSPKVWGPYHIAVCAKVDGKWDLTNINERTISIFVR